jgi:hypothetical protein
MDEIWTCSTCGRSLDQIRRLSALPTGGYVCNECEDAQRTRCWACGKKLQGRAYVETYQGQRVCFECMRRRTGGGGDATIPTVMADS